MKIYVLCRTELVGDYGEHNLNDVLDSMTFYTTKRAAEKAKKDAQYVVELIDERKTHEQTSNKRK